MLNSWAGSFDGSGWEAGLAALDLPPPRSLGWGSPVLVGRPGTQPASHTACPPFCEQPDLHVTLQPMLLAWGQGTPHQHAKNLCGDAGNGYSSMKNGRADWGFLLLQWVCLARLPQKLNHSKSWSLQSAGAGEFAHHAGTSHFRVYL